MLFLNDVFPLMHTVYPLNITNIRLAGTAGPYHGRVELEVNGTWGTIADDFFYQSEAQVVCRMLGLEYESFSLFSYVDFKIFF